MPPKRKHSYTESIDWCSSSTTTPNRIISASQMFKRTYILTTTLTATCTPSQTTETQTPPPISVTSDLSNLRPTEPRRNAFCGHRDESLLRVPCKNLKTGRYQQQDFQKRNASEIDWNNNHHIADINNWRNQIYGRAGMKVKEVNAWLPDEELWIELYFHLSIAETCRRGIRLPRRNAVGEAFLAFFEDRELTDRYGQVVPRKPHALKAFASKLNRVFPQLRERLAQFVMGTSGDVFVPTVTGELLARFKRLKADMAANGVSTQSGEFQNSTEWQKFFLSWPTLENTDNSAPKDEEDGLGDLGVASMEEDNDAAATLISMASQPDNTHTPTNVRRKCKAKNEDVASYARPSVLRSPFAPPGFSFAVHASEVGKMSGSCFLPPFSNVLQTTYNLRAAIATDSRSSNRS